MIKILYEDENITVCEKPVGVSSQSDKSNDMVKLLREQCGSDIYPVHRLDTAVGGVMVFAKNKKAAADLSSQITSGEFVKKYLAVTDSVPEKRQGIYEDLLFKDSRSNKSYVVKRERKGVKKASLEYEVIAEAEGKALVKIRLFTGRTHQIRVQFASRRTPLTGDGKYGSRVNSCNIALWSYSVEFNCKGGKMCFKCEPDNIFPWNLFTK
ncbi:MAG: RluA family pseudouridine synthase [Clostridia bacterium]|nr:RluA family pseudouridine synthase [Clostridia bacterium]